MLYCCVRLISALNDNLGNYTIDFNDDNNSADALKQQLFHFPKKGYTRKHFYLVKV